MAGRFKTPAGLTKGKTDPLSQRIPVNPKYKDVRPTVDTGASLTKQLERIKEFKANYKFKKGEIFKRMKVASLVALMIEVAEMNRAEAEASSSKTRPETPNSDDPSASTCLDDDEPAKASAATPGRCTKCNPKIPVGS